MGIGVSLWVMAWIRYIVHLILVCALIMPSRGMAVLRTPRPWAQITRGATMSLATLSFFTTLDYLPQAEATSISFLSPLLVLVLSQLALRGRPRVSRCVVD